MSAAAVATALAHAAAPVAVTATWQGLAIAMALTATLKLVRCTSAAQRFAAWAAGFAAVAALPLMQLLGRVFETQGPVASSALVAYRPWLELAPAWSAGIALVWVAASLLRAVDLGVHVVRLRRMWKNAVPIDLPLAVDGTKTGLHNARKMQICASTELDRPGVIGFFAPRILLPAWLLERLTPGELEQVVLHEAEHLRRGDDWTNLLQKIGLVLFPLNPGLWWIEHRLCREREMACDEGVVQRTRAPRAYAACLASLAERGLQRRTEALTLGAWQRRPELADRVHRILARSPKMSPVATGGFLAVVFCTLVAGSAELARCPQLVAFDAVRTSSPIAEWKPGATQQPLILNATLRTPTLSSARTRRTHAASTVAAISAHEAIALPARATQAMQEPRAVATRVEMPPTAGAGPNLSVQAQFVVVAAWEQMEVVEPAPHVWTDYDATEPQADAAAMPAVEHFTVTRLIFRIVPKVATPAAQPAVRDGWLTLQL